MNEMWRQLFSALGLVTQIGLVVAVSIYLGWLAGSFLDGRWGNGYLFSVLGLVVGVFAGFLVVYQMIRNLMEREGNA